MWGRKIPKQWGNEGNTDMPRTMNGTWKKKCGNNIVGSKHKHWQVEDWWRVVQDLFHQESWSLSFTLIGFLCILPSVHTSTLVCTLWVLARGYGYIASLIPIQTTFFKWIIASPYCHYVVSCLDCKFSFPWITATYAPNGMWSPGWAGLS